MDYLFEIEIYKDLGLSVCITLLDLLNKNDYNRILRSDYNSYLNVYHSIVLKVLDSVPYRLDDKLKKETKPIILRRNYE